MSLLGNNQNRVIKEEYLDIKMNLVGFALKFDAFVKNIPQHTAINSQNSSNSILPDPSSSISSTAASNC